MVVPLDFYDRPMSRLLNVAVVSPATAGYLVAYGCDDERTPPPNNFSTLNFRAGDVVAHLSTVNRDEGQQVCLMSSADTEVVVDDVGTLEAETDGALRSFDRCFEVQTMVDGDGPFFLLFPDGDAWSDSALFSAIGTDGPFDITATGPAGWLISLTPDDTDANRFSWDIEVPAGSTAGTFAVSLTLTTASDRSFTLTSAVSYDPDGPPPLPRSC